MCCGQLIRANWSIGSEAHQSINQSSQVVIYTQIHAIVIIIGRPSTDEGCYPPVHTYVRQGGISKSISSHALLAYKLFIPMTLQGRTPIYLLSQRTVL